MKAILHSLFIGLLCFSTYAQKVESFANVNSKASLRGLSALSGDVCWFSGNNGTVLKTLDAGNTFIDVSPTNYNSFDFRDIHVFGTDTALILSAGLPAVILKTIDGGKTWKETYRNETEGIFFDGMDFWDKKRGLAFSDAIKNKVVVLKTINQGDTWQTLDTALLPTVADKQGGFAASGTSICTFGKTKAAIGLGGASATLLLTYNEGNSWIKTELPIQSGSAESGIFSIHFIHDTVGIAVGGNYLGDTLTTHSVAYTTNAAKSWITISDPAIHGKYRSCVKFVSLKQIVATSRTGLSFSKNGGETWQAIQGDYYSISVGLDGVVWLSGSQGNIGKFVF